MYSIPVPDSYGYVLLSCLVGHLVANTMMSGAVMEARKTFQIGYPNCYATPGYHDKADEFNRVQRGHMNYFEQLTCFTACALIGGLKHPWLSVASSVFFHLGSIFYQKGYADLKLDVKMARYKKGGGLKYIGFFTAIGTTISLSGSICGWW